MRGYLVDPVTRRIDEVEVGDWRTIAPLLGCDLFTVVNLENGDSVFVDDEGLLKGADNKLFLIEGWPQPLIGKGLVLGGPDEEGESTPPSADRDWLVENVDFGEIWDINGVLMFRGDRNIRLIQ